MTKEDKALQDKFIRMIKAHNERPFDKDISKKLSAIWKQMDGRGL